MTTNETPNPFPDNAFFENEAGLARGVSWKGEIEGMPATYGVIQPGTYEQELEQPEVVIVHEGALAIRTHANKQLGYGTVHYSAPFAVTLPYKDPFDLRACDKSEQFFSQDDNLVYTCLRPEPTVEGVKRALIIAEKLGATLDTHSLGTYGYNWYRLKD